ncbi:cobyrinate a,c-diamide synthase [Rubellimicrobium arenae]|uniref:cobyrinate a,c-diamide synthase n=1 Tax=Rubellimicrobium arenae TaxID=2817372 RepID=UPI001B315088|nr:cobyrinate a,c-diamide synthase [Rubellimicrobium arenae]
MGGLIVAAPSSGSGKTTVTLGLLRALSRKGVPVRAAKSGPDYIDPRFHEAACGQPCVNLDAWAMSEDRLRSLAAGGGLLVIEGAMGLFDGAPPDGRGATADLARLLDLPVVLVVDASRMAQSIGPLVAGFARHDPRVKVAGVILNKVGSERHARMLRRAVEAVGLPVLGLLGRSGDLAHPSRHLGLVQAGERPDLDAFLDAAADRIEAGLDLDALVALGAGTRLGPGPRCPSVAPPAQRIAIARDEAFAFAYPHLLSDWRAQGAELAFFSPLADEAVPEVDLVILPGGYPELHAGRIAGASVFMQSLRSPSQASDIYGECGGYMVLGDSLVDAEGVTHGMAGLLSLETSFATRRLHLGYREVDALGGPFPGRWTAHEFHYATTVRAEGPPLFRARDAEGTQLPPMGLRRGRVSGSFAHLIDRVDGQVATPRLTVGS